MKKKRVSAVLGGLALLLAGACGKSAGNAPGGTADQALNDKLIVIGVDATFEEKWNPFSVESAYDHQVIDQIFTPICLINERNELEPYGGDISYQENPDGTVLYTITINKGMTFTNGQGVTIDDYIWSIYVRADPSYTGVGSALSSFIEGLENYYYDDPDYADRLKTMEQEAKARYSPGTISLEDFLDYARATNLDGWWKGNPGGGAGGGKTWSDYAKDEGFGDQLAQINPGDPAAMLDLIGEIEWKNYRDGYDTSGWALEKAKKDYALGNLSEGVTVKEISGIKKIDDYTCTVLITKKDIYGDRGLTTQNGFGKLIPRSYYGDITKGDVSAILANMNPLGSGPYIWQGFRDNIATCRANKDFFKGIPKTGRIRWQYIPQTEIISALASGVIDIANPSASKTNIAEMDRLGLRYDLIDNPGYGYMAMNTQRVPLLVRKGYWCLMNRGPSVEGYFGAQLAQVIERPMTTTVAEYPSGAAPYYPYSREEALKYFQEAGYSQVNGKLVDSAGKQLVLNTYIGGSGEGNHPAYAMLVQAAEDMRSLGGEIQIQDVAFNVLQGAMNDGAADGWIMAWTSVYDCNKAPQFRSDGSQNRYNFKDPKMDGMLDRITETIDLGERRVLVAEMLDYAMDRCLELPLYQRKNAIAYNTNTLDMNTVPKAATAADYENVLWQVDVKQ